MSEDKRDLVKKLTAIKKIDPLIPWDDLNEGEWYHSPPYMYMPRFDFIIEQKESTFIKIRKRGNNYSQIVNKYELYVKFFCKRWQLTGNYTKSKPKS